MAYRNYIENIIPLNTNELLIKYVEMTKTELIQNYIDLGIDNNYGKTELERLSRRDLTKLFADYYKLKIDENNIPENKMSKSSVINILLTNLETFFLNRVKTVPVNIPSDSVPHIEDIDAFTNILQDIFIKPLSLEIFSIECLKRELFTTRENYYGDPIYTSNKITFLSKSDNKFNDVIKSMLTGSPSSLLRIYEAIESNHHYKVCSFFILLRDENTYYEIKSAEYINGRRGHNIDKTLRIVTEKDIVTNVFNGDYFKFGKTFTDISFFCGYRYLSTFPPHKLYDLVYEIICKKDVDHIRNFLSGKIEQLENGRKYMEFKLKIDTKQITFKSKKDKYSKLIDMEKNILFPSFSNDIICSADFDMAISEYTNAVEKYISNFIDKKIAEFCRLFNTIVDIDIKFGKTDCDTISCPGTITIDNNAERIMETEIALRAALINLSTETKIKVLFIRDEHAILFGSQLMENAKKVCPSIIVITNVNSPGYN